MINTNFGNKNILVPQQTLFDPNRFWGSVLLGVTGGIAGGVLMGIVGRASMRAVVLLSGQTASFSLAGTLAVIAAGTVIGLLLGLVFGFIFPFLPGSVSQKGLAWGIWLALFIACLALFIKQEGELALVSKWAVILLFAPLFLLYGFVLGKFAAHVLPDGLKVSEESGRFVQTAAFLTIIAAVGVIIIEIVQLIAYPATSNLGYAISVFLENVVGGLSLLMTITGVVALLRSGATGANLLARIGLGFALLMFTLLGVVALTADLNMVKLHGLVKVMVQLKYNENLLLLITLLFASLSGLVLAGIAVLRTQRWQGWHRYVPLLLGLYPFLSLLVLHPAFLPSLLPMTIMGRNLLAHGVGALFAMLWLALGWALRAETNLSQVKSDA